MSEGLDLVLSLDLVFLSLSLVLSSVLSLSLVLGLTAVKASDTCLRFEHLPSQLWGSHAPAQAVLGQRAPLLRALLLASTSPAESHK